MIAELLKIAEAELGYLEKASNSQLEDKTANAGSGNFTKYGEWFGQNPAQWCAMFVSWCMDRAGAGALAPKYSYCYSGIEWFKAKASFHEKAGYTPQGGDVIFFSSPSMPRGGAHTGLVLRSDEKLVYTIEGNTSGGSTLVSNGGGVAKKSYSLGYESIFGYGTANFKEEDDDMSYEQFKEYMDKYNAEIAKLPGSAWSEGDRKWAEDCGIILGDEAGNKKWKSPITREEYAAASHRQAQK